MTEKLLTGTLSLNTTNQPTASSFRKQLSIYVFSYFPFGFEGRIWDLIVSGILEDQSLASLVLDIRRIVTYM